jgi:hypothetical protein
MRALCALTILFATLAGTPAVHPAIPTFPPPPDERPRAQEALASAALSLYAGRPEEAYRHILEAEPALAGDAEWRHMAALVNIAMDRPEKALGYLADSIDSHPAATDMVLVLLQRQGNNPPHPSLKPTPDRWRGLSVSEVKESLELMPASDGTLWIMEENRLTQVSGEGNVLRRIPMQELLDLVPGSAGDPVALGKTKLFWRDTLLPIPPGISDPISLSETPDGELILLDGKEPALFRVDFSGKVTGRRALTLSKPVRVRTDAAGRIYILDRSKESVHVYSAALAPLKGIFPKEQDISIRRPDNLFVDFAGNFMIFDGRGREVFLFSSDGRFLGSSLKDDARIDAVGWDGFFNLVFADKKDGTIGRLRL